MSGWYLESDVSEIKEKVNTERNKYAVCDIEIYPPNNDIFRCFSYFSPQQTRVVILGQDPYHGPDQATGLAFGVNNSQKLPPSLRNIAKELKSDLGLDLRDQTLESWAQQGVLLLNTSLSVIQGNAGSHIKYWKSFINHILSVLRKQSEIIFIVWGDMAYKRLLPVMESENENKHRFIISSHPSPLSANRKLREHPSFIGSRPFSKVNNILKNFKSTPISW